MDFDPNAPLDRLAGESKRAYAAFYDYAMMGAARSLRKLLETYRPKDNPITSYWRTISGWSRRYHWVKRAERFDALTRERALAALELHWQEKVMGSTETLGRLSEQARVSIADFVTIKLVPTALIVPSKKDDDEESEETEVIKGEHFVQVVELNWDAIKQNGHLVRSITNTKYGPRIELHDGQAALVNVGRRHKLFVDTVNSVIEHKNDPKDNERADKLNQSVSALAQAIGEMLSGTGSQSDSQMVSSE